MVARATFAASCVLLAAACAASPTQIVVVTDTDLRVTDEVDDIRLDVTSPDGRMQSAEADLRADPYLPRTTTLAWDEGPLGPFIVRAVARRHGSDVVSRTARVSFLPGRIVMLRLDLLDGCRGVDCDTGKTCGNAAVCRPVDIDASELVAWSGEPPPALGHP